MKKGIFFSVLSFFVILGIVFSLSFVSFKKSIENSISISETNYNYYDEFVDDVSEKHFSVMMDISSKVALREISANGTALSNLTVNLTELILTGNLTEDYLMEIMDYHWTIPYFMDEMHDVFLFPNYNYSFEIIDLNLTQLDWWNLSLYYEARYSLDSKDINISKIFNDTLFFDPYGFTIDGIVVRDEDGWEWIENSSLNCYLKEYNPSFNCGIINGTNRVSI